MKKQLKIKTIFSIGYKFLLFGMGLDDFHVLNKLGQGTYSKVYKCQRIVNKTKYALKKVLLNNLSHHELQNALNEVRILASLNNEHILSYKQAFVEKGCLFIVTEFCNFGDLKGKIDFYRKYSMNFSQPQIWEIVTQTLKGLKKLHNLNIIHRDIKSANIFLNKDNVVKIGDFNVAKIITDKFLQTQAGTPFYASPQVLSKLPYDFKSDIWSLGCVFYELTSLKVPFRAKNIDELKEKIFSGENPKISSKYSKDLKVLIRSMLNPCAKKRPSIDRLLKFMYEKQKSNYIEPQQEDQVLLKTIIWKRQNSSEISKLPSPRYSKRKIGKIKTDLPELPELKRSPSQKEPAKSHTGRRYQYSDGAEAQKLIQQDPNIRVLKKKITNRYNNKF